MNLKYRQEIDGLRAVAVIPVILFHAGFKLFGGGFVGVDVFFVISGYLITGIILGELEEGRFSIVNFYERRARRILPALYLVILVTLPFAWLWLLPHEMRDYSNSLVAVSAFASNILFFQESGYFGTAAELKPLLHTWSLAVEEQYYLFFPILLMLTWRLGKRWIIAILGCILLLSLFTAHWSAVAYPDFTFYLLPTRAWELFIGALVAFYLANENRPTIPRKLGESLSLLGLLLIGFSVLVFNRHIPFPSFYALVPTLGTALIILFSNQETLVGKILSHKGLVAIGLISYSAYLWHYPLFAFARVRELGQPSPLLMTTLTVATLILAFFSWKYVEAPFRNKRKISRKPIFLYSIMGMMTFVSLGFTGKMNNGFDSRRPPNITWESLGQKLEVEGDICKLEEMQQSPGILACEFGDKRADRTVVLYGDSHAQALGEELNNIFKVNRIRGLRAKLNDCEIVPTIRRTSKLEYQKANCEKSFAALLELIKKEKSDIIASSRWTYHLYPIANEITYGASRNSEGGVEKRHGSSEFVAKTTDGYSYKAKDKQKALENFIEGLLSTGQSVYMVYPVPEISWDIARMNFFYYQENGRPLDQISIPHKDFKDRNRFVNRIFDGFNSRDKFIAVKPEQTLCSSYIAERCVAQYDSKPLYYDDDHLSNRGAKLVIHDIAERLLQTPK